jgi:prolyl-tRNA editing enzyme YbaK/EbsC (Cys-tRNA(Pro) deacylase)
MPQPESPSVPRVQAVLAERGIQSQVVMLARSARTSVEAAEQVGCRVAQIAKSLVFRGRETGQAWLVIASGANRVDERRLAELVAEPVEKADAQFVRERTGFAIGGVAPVGHAQPVGVLIDEDLLAWDDIWAAAGHPHTVFRLAAADLPGLTSGRVVRVAVKVE